MLQCIENFVNVNVDIDVNDVNVVVVAVCKSVNCSIIYMYACIQ